MDQQPSYTKSSAVIKGRYRLRDLLGVGGMGQVWSAIDERLGRTVAVKMVDPAIAQAADARQRFDREARAAAALSHPNVVAVHDVGVDGATPYLVMEFVDGETVADVLQRGPLPPVRAIDIAGQVCDALAAAHRIGIVHRDIKPGNVLLTRAGVAKVCDFGIARLAGADAQLTAAGATLGTAAYMAPEQARGDAIDARADLYSLGCVLYAMCVGQPPFTADTPVGVALKHIHEPAVPLGVRRPDLPAELISLVDDLLAKSPVDRPASATVVRSRLATARAAAATVAAGPQTQPLWAGRAALPTAAAVDVTMAAQPAARSAVGRLPLIATVIVLLLAGLAVATIVALQSGDGGSPINTPTTSSAGAATAPPSTAALDPIAALQAVRTAVQNQVVAGQLDPDSVKDLGKKLDEIERELRGNGRKKTAEKTEELHENLEQLREDGKLTPAGMADIETALRALDASLARRD